MFVGQESDKNEENFRFVLTFAPESWDDGPKQLEKKFCMRKFSPANNVMKINHESNTLLTWHLPPIRETMDLNNWERQPVTSNERILCLMWDQQIMKNVILVLSQVTVTKVLDLPSPIMKKWPKVIWRRETVSVFLLSVISRKRNWKNWLKDIHKH